MSSFINRVSGWAQSPAPKSVNGDKEPRGTKRKAKGDPYDEIDDDGSGPKTTPSTQRARSRISSESPSSSNKGRPSSTGRASKRRSRSWVTRRVDAAEASRVDTNANLTRAQEPQAAHLQPQTGGEYTKSSHKGSLVPVADMSVPESSHDDNAATNTNGPTNDAELVPAKRTAAAGDPKAKGKANATRIDEEEKNPEEVDEREEQEVKALLQHRVSKDNTGRVELLVHWVGEKEEEATWETEEEIQRGAEETLYAYWKAQGGRMNALFIRPKNPPPEIYHVFSILHHEKKARGGFEFEVQWVGHPPTRGETTMETEPKLKKIAPKLLEGYWESVGGREKHLAKRGRNRRPRSDIHT